MLQKLVDNLKLGSRALHLQVEWLRVPFGNTVKTKALREKNKTAHACGEQNGTSLVERWEEHIPTPIRKYPVHLYNLMLNPRNKTQIWDAQPKRSGLSELPEQSVHRFLSLNSFFCYLNSLQRPHLLFSFIDYVLGQTTITELFKWIKLLIN